MAVDRETSASVWINIDKNPKLMNLLEKNNESVSDESKKNPQFLINEDIGTVKCEEYYLEEGDNTLHYTGTMATPHGGIYISFDLPISDVILIDLLQMSIKKLNKLKVAMESLK